ncbi:uncharacterized protein LOC120336093 isoform X1 [Styela clava]
MPWPIRKILFVNDIFIDILLKTSDRGINALPTFRPDSDNISVYKCKSAGICYDENDNEFRCITRNLECCHIKTEDQFVLFNAPRGEFCCPGAGMFDEQIEKCVNGEIVRRLNVRTCPNTIDEWHNTKTQTCCTSKSGKTKVHLLEDGKVCCGENYIQNSTKGCCNGQEYNRKSECCKNRMIVSAQDCSKEHEVFEKIGCHKELECSEEFMEKTFHSHSHKPSYMYSFTVGELNQQTETHLIYEANSCRQYTGTRKRKKQIRTKKCNLKFIDIPKCECPGKLVSGFNYILKTRQKIVMKKLMLDGKNYYITRNNLF